MGKRALERGLSFAADSLRQKSNGKTCAESQRLEVRLNENQ